LDKLIYFEEWENEFEALKQEMQLKNGKKIGRVNLIEDMDQLGWILV
jgi:predicted GIY-YIG superfamily endonuclease